MTNESIDGDGTPDCHDARGPRCRRRGRRPGADVGPLRAALQEHLRQGGLRGRKRIPQRHPGADRAALVRRGAPDPARPLLGGARAGGRDVLARLAHCRGQHPPAGRGVGLRLALPRHRLQRQHLHVGRLVHDDVRPLRLPLLPPSSGRSTTSTPSSIPTASSAARSGPTVRTASSATTPRRRVPTCCRGSSWPTTASTATWIACTASSRRCAPMPGGGSSTARGPTAPTGRAAGARAWTTCRA